MKDYIYLERQFEDALKEALTYDTQDIHLALRCLIATCAASDNPYAYFLLEEYLLLLFSAKTGKQITVTNNYTFAHNDDPNLIAKEMVNDFKVLAATT